MIIIKALCVQIAEMGRFEAERIDVGLFEPVAEHLREGFLVGDLNDSDAAGFQDAIELVHDFLHVAEMVGGADHHEGVEGIVGEGQGINIAGLSMNLVAVEVVGLGELGFGIVEESSDFRTV